MDHCLLNPEYLNIEQNPVIARAPFVSLTWFWEIWAIPDVVWIEFVDPIDKTLQNQFKVLSIHVADLCLTNQVL